MSESASHVDLSNMKVAELRASLEERGLDSTGKKAELQERLLEALEKEKKVEYSATKEDARSEDVVATGSSAMQKTEIEGIGLADDSVNGKAKKAPLSAGSSEDKAKNDSPGPPPDELLESFLTSSERIDLEKLKERAARFGTAFTGIPADLRQALVKRYQQHRRLERALERHGGVVPVDDAEQERRRKRLDRFGLSKPVLELEMDEQRKKRADREQARVGQKRKAPLSTTKLPAKQEAKPA